MKLSPDASFEDKYPARLAAQAIVRARFNLAEAARELRPDLKHPEVWGAKLLDQPEVVNQVERIMNRLDRNASTFKSTMWDWLEAPPGDKDVEEKRRTAARILAKPYLDPKMSKSNEAAQGFVVEGLESGAGVLDGSKKEKVQ